MEPGTILAGRYRVGRSLGAGGMGVIVEGTHLELGTQVAIKILHDQLARDPDRVERFLREARAAAQLKGEHVCRVHDFGTLPGGEPFMVMELLAGCDLSALVDQLGPLSSANVIAYMRQACAGVAEAHARGIVHRDLKPTNIFRTNRPDGAPLIKILDFGIAKPMNGQDLSLTATSTVVGSPLYMSPEQLKSPRLTDPRCDIWALGVVMYELLTTKAPFTADTITELTLSITNDPVPPLPPTVPPALVAVVMRCLDKDPAKRYQSIAELADALDAAAAAPTELPVQSSEAANPPSEPPLSEVAIESPEPASQPSPASLDGVLDSLAASALLARPMRRRRWPYAAGAAAVLVVAAAVYAGTRTHDEEPPARVGAPEPAAVPISPPTPPSSTPPPSVPTAPIDAAVEATTTPDAAPQAAEVRTPSPPTPKRHHASGKRRPGDLTKSRY